MITPFDLIRSLKAHFFARGEVINTGGLDINLGAGNLITTGTVDGVDISALSSSHSSLSSFFGSHIANANAHHNQQHTLDGSDHTGTLSWVKVSKTGSSLADLATRAHSDLSGIGANDHHNQQHTLDGSDHTGTLSWAKVSKTGSSLADLATRTHSSLTGIGANDHHNQQHGLDSSDHTGTLSWSKVNKTGSSLADLATRAHSDLSELTTGDPHSVYYLKTAFSSSSGISSVPLKTDSGGLLAIRGLGVGATPQDFNIVNGGDIKAAGGLVSGSINENPIAGEVIMKETFDPSTPTSGFGTIWVNTSGQLWFKNDAGTATRLA